MNPMRVTAISLTLLFGYLIFSRKDFQSCVIEITTKYWIIFYGGVANVLVGMMVLPVMGGELPTLSSALFDIMVYAAFALGAAYLYWKNGRKVLHRFILIICSASAILLPIGTIERMQQMVLWRSLIPPGFGGEDAALIQSIMAGAFRDGNYRVQSVFSNPLLFAEYLAVTSPILLSAMLWTKNNTLRFILFPLYIYGLYAALVFPSARLSFVALVAGHCAIGSLGLLYWKRHSNSRNLLADAGLLAIPAAVSILSVLLLFSRRFQIFVFGGREHAGSNEARSTQWEAAFRSLPQSPVFGFGYGEAVDLAGTVGQKQTLTIDSWYINVMLESGVIGTSLYAAAFFAATYRACQLSVLIKGRDAALMMALTAMMVAKMTINGVLSLTHNHVLLFFAYGIVIGASLRYQEQLKAFKWLPGRNDKPVHV